MSALQQSQQNSETQIRATQKKHILVPNTQPKHHTALRTIRQCLAICIHIYRKNWRSLQRTVIAWQPAVYYGIHIALAGLIGILYLIYERRWSGTIEHALQLSFDVAHVSLFATWAVLARRIMELMKPDGYDEAGTVASFAKTLAALSLAVMMVNIAVILLSILQIDPFIGQSISVKTSPELRAVIASLLGFSTATRLEILLNWMSTTLISNFRRTMISEAPDSPTTLKTSGRILTEKNKRRQKGSTNRNREGS